MLSTKKSSSKYTFIILSIEKFVGNLIFGSWVLSTVVCKQFQSCRWCTVLIELYLLHDTLHCTYCATQYYVTAWRKIIIIIIIECEKPSAVFAMRRRFRDQDCKPPSERTHFTGNDDEGLAFETLAPWEHAEHRTHYYYYLSSILHHAHAPLGRVVVLAKRHTTV